MRIRSSYFKRKMVNLATIKPGYWIPIFCKPTNIGDHWSIDMSDTVRNFARVAPTYGAESLRIAAFYVQNKDIWDGWWNFRTGGPDNMDTSAIPYMIHSYAKGDVGFNTLSDYLSTANPLTFYDQALDGDGNLTFTPNTKAFRSRCLAERAYAKIGRDWLMNQNLEDPDTDYPLSTAGAEDGEDTTTNRQLFPCHWNHDYFTNQVNSQIKGSSVVIPIGTEAPVVGDGKALGLTNGTVNGGMVQIKGNYNGLNAKADAYGATLPASDSGAILFSQNDAVGITTDTEKSGLIAKLDATTGFSLRTLNMGVAVTKIGNMLVRHGSRPVEFMNTFFGVKSSDARLDRSVFLGSYSTDFITSPVTQTSSSDAVSAQGHQAGQGFHAAKYPKFSCYCEEDGWIMILAAIRPKTAYCNGVPAYHMYSSRYDYINPVFQHLDYTTSKMSEIYATGVDNGDDSTDWDSELVQDNEKFGLHPQFQEWRSFPSEVHGDFLGSLRDWHVARIFTSKPQLNKQFIQVGSNFPMRQFAVTTGIPYLAEFSFNIRLRRKLAKFGTPKYFGVI